MYISDIYICIEKETVKEYLETKNVKYMSSQCKVMGQIYWQYSYSKF